MNLPGDVRHAVRTLVRSPGFAAITILTLALGIGANTAIFSVVNATILQPLPYPAPERLVFISSQFPEMGFNQFWISPPEFLEFQERTRAFSSVGAFATGEANLTAPDRPRRVNTARVSAELFTVLGVKPLAGRTFEMPETRPNGAQVAILSHDVWRSAFGSDPQIVGRSVEINGTPRTIVGIMPPRFDVLDRHVDVWVPLVLDPANRLNRGNHLLYLIGRLSGGTTLAGAQAELESLLAAWPSSISPAPNAAAAAAPAPPAATAPTGGAGPAPAAAHAAVAGGSPPPTAVPQGAPSPSTPPRGPHTPNVDRHRLRYDRLQDQVVGSAKTAVLVLQGAVVLVLLIACANVASLLLARAESRHKEFAVRAALGAGRWTLVRPFMLEAGLLSFVGGALGLAVGVLGIRSLIVAFPRGLPRSGDVTLDAGVLAFALVVALGSAMIVGLAPLLHLSPNVTATALKEAGQRTTVGVGRNRMRRALVAGEVALAVALVTSAGLLIRTVVNLSRVDTGFNRSRLVTFGVSLPPAKYAAGPPILSFYQRLLGDLRALPGVDGVAAMTGLPPSRQVDANDTRIEGYTAPPTGPFENVDYYQTITTDYVNTMGIPIVEGRNFQASDAAGPAVVLINETMARTFFRNVSPIGRRVHPSGPNTPWYTIVGVLKDVKQGGVDQKTGTELYFNFEQQATNRAASGTMNVTVRSSASVDRLAAPIRRAVAGLDPTLPVVRLRSMDDVFDEAIGRSRLLADLLGVFSALALTLAAIGTYGVLSYMVTERQREIGIRMALGAGRSVVLRMVLSQGFALTLVGLAAGLALALTMNRLLTTLLFGVAPTDPVTIAAVVTLIAGVSMVGCYLPARRATRVDPMIVLRDD